MFAIFTLTAEYIGVLFLFAALGYGLQRTGRLPAGAATLLSKLEYYIFLPCLYYGTFSRNCTLAALRECAELLVADVGYILLIILLTRVVMPLIVKDKVKARIYEYGLMYPNTTYVGMPLMSMLFGERAVFLLMTYTLPQMIENQVVGVNRLDPTRRVTLKGLLSPSLVCIFLGIAAGLTGFTLPMPLMTAVEMGSNCMVPSAMLVTGVILASHSFRALFVGLEPYVVSFVRLLAMPALVTALACLAGIRAEYLIIIGMAAAMPFGMNSVIYAQLNNGDVDTSARVTFLTHICGILTLPLVTSVLLSLFPAM